MKKDLPSISQCIISQRKKAGISQNKLSKLAGIALYTIARIEAGATYDPRISTVKRIAHALRIPVATLLK